MSNDEKLICVLCGKEMKAEEWTWGEDDAHKDCVLDIADSICSNDCGYFDVLDGNDDVCRECGVDMRPITKEDKKKWRKQTI